MVAHSQCVWARCLLVGVPVVLGDGLGFVFPCMTVHKSTATNVDFDCIRTSIQVQRVTL